MNTKGTLWWQITPSHLRSQITSLLSNQWPQSLEASPGQDKEDVSSFHPRQLGFGSSLAF